MSARPDSSYATNVDDVSGTLAVGARRHCIGCACAGAGLALAGVILLTPRIAGAQGLTTRAHGLATNGLPLPPTRTARFRVTEGTWISLDVSPNGQTIVFDLLGHLYTLPIGGGQARRLTSGMAFYRQPRYSPDGHHLVFISDQSGSANIWISDGDGRHARQLSDLHGNPYGAVTSPAWSRDGRTIVASQMLSAARPGRVAESQFLRWLLAAYDVNTGRMRWISDTAAGEARAALGAAFGPRNDVVYAAIDDFLPRLSSDLEDPRIVQVELTTGRIRSEMGVGAGRAGMRPAISPDGRYLAYASSSGSRVGLRLRDLSTDEERWLVREALDDPPSMAAYDSRDLIPGYAFTPDSKTLIAAYGGGIRRISLATGRVAVIPFKVDVARNLGPLTVHQFTLSDTAVRTRSVSQPALSPDGRWVTFSALDRLWIMELPHDGRPAGQLYRLTADSAPGEFYPSWAPDGNSIVYSTWLDGEGGAVRRVRVVRDELARPPPSDRLTTDTALYFHTAVSPRGDRVVAVRVPLPPDRALLWGAASDPTLIWIPAEGGFPRTITSLRAEQHNRYPYPVAQLYFTSDPERIYVGLASWRWDGTNRRSAVVAGLRVGSPYDQGDVAGVVSPNQCRALLEHRRVLFELALSCYGSEPDQVRAQPGWLNDTVDITRLRTEAFGRAPGAARRWGVTLSPWVSWSRDGRRVLFSQGGALLVGDVGLAGWTTFVRLDTPLMVPADVPRGTLVLRRARLITMHGREVIERGDLIVRDNRILALGPSGSVPIPPGAHVLDLHGTTILPGYVDVHDHLLLPRGIHPGQCWQCLLRLAYGVTTSRDPQPSFDADVFSYRERERTGSLLGPRVFSTGIAYQGTDPPIQTLDDARNVVRPYAEYFGSETFKIHYDPSADRRTRQLLAMAASEKGLNATVHGQGTELDLTVIIDGFSGLEHLPLIPIYDDVATLIAQSRTAHTQTYGTVSPGGWHYLLRRYGDLWKAARMRRFAPPAARAVTCARCTSEGYYGPPELSDLLPLVRGAARIVARGGKVGMGSHGTIPGLGLHYEMWLHAVGGMSNQEILRSATIVGGAAIGHMKDLGSLEPGKLADLQVLERNPLDDIHNTSSIRYVMKNGRLYQAEDLTEIWPHQKPLTSAYLWEPTSP